MCMRPAHQLGGFVAGAALAMYAHQPLWVAVPSAAVASLTAGGRFSPDADQYKGWKLFDKYTPDELLGRGGPLQHRGITHARRGAVLGAGRDLRDVRAADHAPGPGAGAVAARRPHRHPPARRPTIRDHVKGDP
jgi:hypothetical protein